MTKNWAMKLKYTNWYIQDNKMLYWSWDYSRAVVTNLKCWPRLLSNERFSFLRATLFLSRWRYIMCDDLRVIAKLNKRWVKGKKTVLVYNTICFRAAFFEQAQGQTQRVRPSETEQIKSRFSAVCIIIEALFRGAEVLKRWKLTWLVRTTAPEMLMFKSGTQFKKKICLVNFCSNQKEIILSSLFLFVLTGIIHWNYTRGWKQVNWHFLANWKSCGGDSLHKTLVQFYFFMFSMLMISKMHNDPNKSQQPWWCLTTIIIHLCLLLIVCNQLLPFNILPRLHQSKAAAHCFATFHNFNLCFLFITATAHERNLHLHFMCSLMAKTSGWSLFFYDELAEAIFIKVPPPNHGSISFWNISIQRMSLLRKLS